MPEHTGADAAGIMAAAAAGNIDVLVLVGADPLADFPDADLARRAVRGAGTVVAVDVFPTASVAEADVVLPAVTFGERTGTHVNIEGRATAVTRQVTPPAQCRRDWEIAAELAMTLGSDLGISSPEAAWAELAALSPLHAGAGWDDVRAHLDGVLLPVASGGNGTSTPSDPGAGSGAMPARLALDDVSLPAAAVVPFDRYSYRLVADRRLFDRGTGVANCPSLASFARPATLRLNPRDLERLGSGPEATLSISSPAGAVTVDATPDDRVPPSVAALAFNSGGADPRELIDIDAPVCEIRVMPPKA